MSASMISVMQLPTAAVRDIEISKGVPSYSRLLIDKGAKNSRAEQCSRESSRELARVKASVFAARGPHATTVGPI